MAYAILTPCVFSMTFPFDRYDLLHNAHLNLEGLDELFKVAQVQTEKFPPINKSLLRNHCTYLYCISLFHCNVITLYRHLPYFMARLVCKTLTLQHICMLLKSLQWSFYCYALQLLKMKLSLILNERPRV